MIKPAHFKNYRDCFFNFYLGLDELFDIDPIESALDWNQEITKPLDISLDEKKSASAAKNLRKMGITEKDWYVCLHVREGNFWLDPYDKRNTNPLDYIKTIKMITDRGGWVIRMGHKGISSLPQMAQVIDYPSTSYKSEFMDLYLIKHCHLYLGQNSGILDVALLFQKKIVLTNLTEWAFAFPMKKNQLAIMKNFFSKKLNRMLSVEELFQLPYSYEFMFSSEIHKDFTIHSNTPDEIYDVTVEAMDQAEDYTYSNLQNQCVEAKANQVQRWLMSTNISWLSKSDHYLRKRIIAHNLGSQGTLGKKFLEQHWKVINSSNNIIHEELNSKILNKINTIPTASLQHQNT